MPIVDEKNPQHWKFGAFYFNRADQRTLVPKRFGIGLTLNFAKPVALILVLVIILPLVLIPLVLILLALHNAG